ncbi:MAG: cytochrome c biogenesis protein CcsA, partial [Planctomycetota bacterium]
TEANPLQDLLKRCGSLRLTVVLFALSIVLVLVGTLAQVDLTMWEVLDQYFRCWVAVVPVKVFFPVTFFPNFPELPSWLRFPFPGGWTLGALLSLNLVAAHATRFRVTAKGNNLILGLILSVIGWALAIFFIVAGQWDWMRDELLKSPALMWQFVRWSVVAFWGLSVIITLKSKSPLDFWLKASASLLLGGLAFFLIGYGSHMRLDDSSLRILWQLAQGLVAGIALLIGSNYLFGQRGGIVVIHAGVALLMIGELLVSVLAVEESMMIREGNTATFARNTEDVELVFIDRSSPDEDVITAVDIARLREGQVFRDPSLPCDVELVRFIKNGGLGELAEGQDPLATVGFGLRYAIQELRPSSGASGGELDMPAAYVRLIPKSGRGNIETYMLTVRLNDFSMVDDYDLLEKFDAGDKTYDVGLRFPRTQKPYAVTLNDIRRDNYIGTATPRDYSSFITLNAPEMGVNDRDVRVWMNNPLRFNGETFYQTSYFQLQDGTEMTSLSLVSNTGWMIPYIACMFAAVGMIAHFSKTLARFVDRVARSARERTSERSYAAIISALVIFNAVVGMGARSPRGGEGKIDWQAAGQIPVVSEGRQKPLDTVARNALKVISLKQSAKYVGGALETKRPAIEWFFDMACRPEQAAEGYQIVRIDSLDMLELLQLEPRKRFRYAFDEFAGRRAELKAAAAAADQVRRQDASKLTRYDHKVLETWGRVVAYEKIRDSYFFVPMPPAFTEAEREADPDAAAVREKNRMDRALAIPELNSMLMRSQPPLTVPVTGRDGEVRWLPYAVAMNEANVASMFRGTFEDPKLKRWTKILDAYRDGDAKAFNEQVADYLRMMERERPDEVNPAAIWSEQFYNHFNAFTLAMVLYLVVFLATALSWLGWFGPLRKFAFWLLLLTFGLHTVALLMRIYISGRPPVTDLHSSAIFIGWGVVLFCLVLEAIFRFSLGNAVAALCGFATLLISDRLALEGDTFTVMQAVLDTQFWLSTHVVCITLGYSATFVAGAFGIFYILARYVLGAQEGQAELETNVIRIIYGSLCFALLFSFVGTVLGGLWADDSWGRFWGWDPKENGALIIVLWNALILHARWGKMIQGRGLACLAVLGNITTAWSWFGVNELAVGLHTYGFTEGALLKLGLFCGAMLAIAILGWWLPDKPSKSKQVQPA